MDAAAADGFAYIQIAAGVRGEGVHVGELTRHVAGPSETGQDVASLAVDGGQEFFPAIGVVGQPAAASSAVAGSPHWRTKNAVLVEDNDAEVAIPIGDVHLAVGRVDRNVGRAIQKGFARIERGSLKRAIRRIEDAFGADLQQQLTAVVGVLLDDGVLITANPHVVLVVDEDSVEIVWDDIRSPRIDHIAVGSQLKLTAPASPTEPARRTARRE